MFSFLEDIYDTDTPLELDESLLNYWEDVINSGAITDDNVDIAEFTTNELYKWRLNLRGLIKSKYNIPYIYIYPIIRYNGITSYDFKYETLQNFKEFKIVKADVLEKFYTIYLQKIKSKGF